MNRKPFWKLTWTRWTAITCLDHWVLTPRGLTGNQRAHFHSLKAEAPTAPIVGHLAILEVTAIHGHTAPPTGKLHSQWRFCDVRLCWWFWKDNREILKDLMIKGDVSYGNTTYQGIYISGIHGCWPCSHGNTSCYIQAPDTSCTCISRSHFCPYVIHTCTVYCTRWQWGIFLEQARSPRSPSMEVPSTRIFLTHWYRSWVHGDSSASGRGTLGSLWDFVGGQGQEAPHSDTSDDQFHWPWNRTGRKEMDNPQEARKVPQWEEVQCTRTARCRESLFCIREDSLRGARSPCA